MKTIILMRHGKSDWDAEFDSDHDRPLAKRGRQAAATMGALIARMDQVPDRVVSSSALRAKDTVALAAASGDWSCPITIAPELYASSPGEVAARLRREEDDAARLLVAGHEPTWSELASALIGGGRLRFPTGAAARIDLDVASWGELDAGRGELVWFLIPRLLKKAGLRG